MLYYYYIKSFYVLFGICIKNRKENTKMKKTLLLVALICMIGFMESPITAKAAENERSEAYELCKSADTWQEYKDIFKDFQYEQGDWLGLVLKELPEKIETLSTFISGVGYGGIKDEKVDEFEEALSYALSLYNADETAHLRFTVKKKDLEGPYSQVDANIENNPLTHIGNVVMCHEIPYYSSVDRYMEDKDAYYYDGTPMCYTCGVAYWNPDGTLEKMEYVPYEDVARLKDAEKTVIDRNFEGTTLILLCTTDTILGWADLDGLFQYEDAMGNMQFYAPDSICYE